MSKNKVGNDITPSDEELIERFQDGDSYAFEQLVYRYKDRLTNFVYNFLRNKVEAEDIVQETFLRLYRNKHSYKKIAKFSTWFYTIAANLAKTELRKRKRKSMLSISNMGIEDKDYDIPDVSLSPEKKVDSNIKEKIIRDKIEKLPLKFREVVILRDIEQCTYEEICEILNIPIGTVKSRINRGRQKLQKELKHLFEA
ncbi:MAG: sigma-70 family RNA polymerase sigma factor [bacterium]